MANSSQEESLAHYAFKHQFDKFDEKFHALVCRYINANPVISELQVEYNKNKKLIDALESNR